MPRTFFILAGESSGDNHAAKLIAELKKLDPTARFIGMGGPAMQQAGLEALKDLDGMQVTGFWEVARQYGFFRRVFFSLLDQFRQTRPDVLICVDYPGFNLRFASEARKLGVPVVYYILPQVWAWKRNRAKAMAKFVDRAFCVFDFEPPFFSSFGLKTEFVGHPLMDDAPESRPKLESAAKTLAMLPGSRSNEFNSHWRPMCQAYGLAKAKIPELRAVLSVQRGIRPDSSIEAINASLREGKVCANGSTISSVQSSTVLIAPESEAESLGQTLRVGLAASRLPAAVLTAAADFSIVKSGTSTLEAGLSGNPMCVIYRGSPLSYGIARLLVNIPVFSLVNIVLGKYAVPELVQDEVCPERLAHEIERGLCDERYRDQQRKDLAQIPHRLGGKGASERAARGILNFLLGK